MTYPSDSDIIPGTLGTRRCDVDGTAQEVWKVKYTVTVKPTTESHAPIVVTRDWSLYWSNPLTAAELLRDCLPLLQHITPLLNTEGVEITIGVKLLP